MLQNKYHIYYDRLIERARTRQLTGYFELHHIQPRSLGGWDVDFNLVKLTAREHLVAHLLLTKFTTGSARTKMLCAAYFMCGLQRKQKNIRVSSRLYESLKKKMLEQKCCYIYEIITPTGDVKTITNLTQFANENDLHYESLRKVVNGQRHQHRGYIIKVLNDNYAKPKTYIYKNPTVYEITRPDGTVQQITNLNEFSIENKLSYSYCYEMINGHRKSLHGFKIKRLGKQNDLKMEI